MRAVQDWVVEASGIVNRFGTQTVHDGLELRLARGSITALVGGSGSGKTVLARTLLMLRRPQSGSLKLFGEDALQADMRQRMVLRRRIGVLFQGGALLSGLSVLDNVALPLREQTELAPALCRELALLKIGLAGLPATAAHRMPDQLSGGMVKRAALARALALDPELLLLDEPTAGLDPVAAAAFDRVLRELRDLLGLTILQITHDLDSIWHGSDSVAFLAGGRVLAHAPALELARRDEAELVAYFRGERSQPYWREALGGASDPG